MKLCDLCQAETEILKKPEIKTFRVNEVCPECAEMIEQAIRGYRGYWKVVEKDLRGGWIWRLYESIKRRRKEKS